MKKEQKQIKHLPLFGLPKLVPYLKPYVGIFLVMVIFDILFGMLDTLTPLFQSYAINNFILPGTLQGLPRFIVLYVVVLLAQVTVNYIAFSSSIKMEMYIGRDLKRAAFNHLQTLSFSYFNQNSVGYIHARVMSDTNRIGSVISWDMMDGVGNLAYLVSASVVMFSINVPLTLLVLSLVPIAVLFSFYFNKKLVKHDRMVREANSRVTGNFNEGITGARTTKTLCAEEKLEQNFDRDVSEMRRLSIRRTHFRALFGSLITFAAFAALALVLWRGGVITMQQAMQIGTLSVFMSYAQNLMEPVRWFVSAISDLVAVQVNIERFTSLMDTKSDVVDTPEVVARYGDTFHPLRENWEPLLGEVEFRDVSFRYPDGDDYVLEHFNLTVPQGTTVAIVGETGAGKSTLVNLVCRFFEPTSGQVLIDGRDARERSQLWLHSHIGYVLQSPHLFSGTVMENLLYGNPNATKEQVEEAVRAVCADKVIARMKDGYDTDVGEGGDLLSTGEKQLLSFARALLADPRIFVLDEATSSVDTVTEALLQKATERIMRGRTSFVVAHRLSTIRGADVILVVDAGRIIEQGTHAELMAQRGAYYELYTHQYRREMTEAVFTPTADGEAALAQTE